MYILCHQGSESGILRYSDGMGGGVDKQDQY